MKRQPRHERRPLSELIPASYNPRTISEKALSGLMDSISRFGLVQPIVVNERTGLVVGGHQRIVALQRLGHRDADVYYVDLDETGEKALNVALNSPHIAGQFSDGLASLLTEIRSADPDAFAELRFDALMPKGAKADDDPPADHDKPAALKFLVTERQRLIIDQTLDMMREGLDKPVRGQKGEQMRNGLILERLCMDYIKANT